MTPSASALRLHYTQSSCLRTVYEHMQGTENKKTDNYDNNTWETQFLYKYNLNYIGHKNNGIK